MGRKAKAPNIAMPVIKPMELQTLKMRSPKRRIGSSGSLTRSSCGTKLAHRRAPAVSNPTIVGEPQAYSLPPQVSARSVLLAAPTMSAAPRKSMRSSTRWCVSFSTRVVTTSARAPSGRLMKKIQRQPSWSVKRPPISGPATLARAHHVGDDRLRHGSDAAGAQALDAAEDDELRHALGGPAQRGAENEEDDEIGR